MTISEIFNSADSITTVGLLFGFVILWIRGKIISPRELQDKEAAIQRILSERNDWQKIAIDAMALGKRTVDVVTNGGKSDSR